MSEEAEVYRSSRYLRQLREKMLKHFSLEELQVLAHDLSVDWEMLPGESKPKKTLELINYVVRYDRLSSLTTLLRDVRPSAEWPGLPSGTVISIEYSYSVEGNSELGEVFLEGQGASSWDLKEDQYFDQGMAISEAMASTASHFYLFELEKKGAYHIHDITISIHSLKWYWNVSD